MTYENGAEEVWEGGSDARRGNDEQGDRKREISLYEAVGEGQKWASEPGR